MIRRAVAVAVMGAVIPVVAGGLASAQECSPPQCTSRPGTVVVDARTGSVAQQGVLSLTDRSTGIPLLSVYAGLSILAFALATIALRRRNTPAVAASPVAQAQAEAAARAALKRRKGTNEEWAAEILARTLERVEKASPVLLGSSEVVIGGHPHPPAGQSGGSDRARR